MSRNRVSYKLFFLILILVFSLFSFGLLPISVASQDKPIEIKFGHVAPPFAHGAKFGMEPWAKKIDKATNGRVKITIYPAQSLFKARDGITAVESGVADMGHLPIGYFPGRFNLITVITLPFLLPNPTSEFATRIIYDLYAEFPEMRKDFSNMKLMMLQPADAYYIITKKRPIRKMNDLKGLKLRVIGRWPSEAMKLAKVNPVMIPMPELYESAAKGVIDGGLIFNTMALDLKMYEVFNYWTDAPIYTSIAVIAMNLDKWNSLPPDIKKTLEDFEFEGAILYARDGYDATKAKLQAAVQEKGKKWERVSLDQGEFERMKEEMGKPIWKAWVADMEKKGLPGQKVLDRALELVNKYQ